MWLRDCQKSSQVHHAITMNYEILKSCVIDKIRKIKLINIYKNRTKYFVKSGKFLLYEKIWTFFWPKCKIFTLVRIFPPFCDAASSYVDLQIHILKRAQIILGRKGYKIRTTVVTTNFLQEKHINICSYPGEPKASKIGTRAQQICV